MFDYTMHSYYPLQSFKLIAELSIVSSSLMTDPNDHDHFLAIEVGKLYLKARKNKQLTIEHGIQELQIQSEEYQKDMDGK